MLFPRSKSVESRLSAVAQNGRRSAYRYGKRLIWYQYEPALTECGLLRITCDSVGEGSGWPIVRAPDGNVSGPPSWPRTVLATGSKHTLSFNNLCLQALPAACLLQPAVESAPKPDRAGTASRAANPAGSEKPAAWVFNIAGFSAGMGRISLKPGH